MTATTRSDQPTRPTTCESDHDAEHRRAAAGDPAEEVGDTPGEAREQAEDHREHARPAGYPRPCGCVRSSAGPLGTMPVGLMEVWVT